MDDLSKNQTSQTLVIAILGCCIFLASIGTYLFKDSLFVTGQFFGINSLIFAVLLMACLLILNRIAGRTFGFTGSLMMVSILFFTLMLVWRDSPVLNALSLMAILLIINLTYSLNTRKKLTSLYLFEIYSDWFASIKYGLKSYHHLISQDIQWQDFQQLKGQYGHSIYKGVLITILPFIMFVSLLSTSDARFEQAIGSLFDWGWNFKKVIVHIALFVFFSLFAAAILRAGVLKKGLTHQPKERKNRNWHLGTIEIIILLGVINSLFLGFIAVQFGYFFGGDTLVQSTGELTYATYARRGFFQLVIVATLVIMLLLVTHWIYKPMNTTGAKIYYWLVIIMVFLTMIIELSAVHRLFLYTSVYGLTELRLYTSVFMFWIVVLFIWFGVTVLRGQRGYFAFGVVLTSLVFIGLLNLVNPDARIAQFNLNYLSEGKIDTRYLGSLSADVIPVMSVALDDLSKHRYHCINLKHQMKSHGVLKTNNNWHYWNWSRYQAKKLILSASMVKCYN